MSNRCPDCERFVSLEISEEDEFNTDPEIDDEGNISAEFRLLLNCVECWGEMKDAAVEFYVEAPEEIQEHINKYVPSADSEDDEPDHEFEVECTSSSVSERYSGDSKTPRRFRKKFYVVELEFSITCTTHPDWPGCTVAATKEVQASYLEDVN